MVFKELGSDFHLMEVTSGEAILNHIFPCAEFYFSGRAALYNILVAGINKNKWENIYFPEYYCHEVSAFLQDLPINNS